MSFFYIYVMCVENQAEINIFSLNIQICFKMLNVSTWPEANCALHIIMEKKNSQQQLKKVNIRYAENIQGKNMVNLKTSAHTMKNMHAFNKGYDQ